MQIAPQTRSAPPPHPNSGLPEFGTIRVAEVGYIRLRRGEGVTNLPIDPNPLTRLPSLRSEVDLSPTETFAQFGFHDSVIATEVKPRYMRHVISSINRVDTA